MLKKRRKMMKTFQMAVFVLISGLREHKLSLMKMTLTVPLKMTSSTTFYPTSSHPASSIAFFRSSCPTMPSSSTQADCSSSCSFSDYAEAFAQYVMRLVQTLRPVVEAVARSAAGYCARLPIGQVLRSAENRKSRDSRVQFLEEIARGNRYSDANSLALMISRRRRRITDWERGDLIGKGSFASVYRGSNEDGFFFAAKGVSLSEHKQLRHLENEIAILERLDHENIIQYYGTERGEEMLYIFLELVSHGTLEQAYKNCPFKESQVSHYTRQILQGLKYLHSCEVVHGDLKCANILVTESGRIKLADFGLSKSMEDHSQSLKLGLGSSYWMAPEVANRKRVGYGFPSDIWSLGCTVTEMSTRKYPQYNARNAVSLDRAIRSGKGPIVPDYLSDTLKDFINQCLQPDPKQRPPAASLFFWHGPN